MNIDALLVVELLALGLAIGFLAGMFGIGGGGLMVPFLTAIVSHRGAPPGLAVKMAIATSMATILFTSLSSLRAHHRHGAVRWSLVRGLAPGIALGGLAAGAGAFALIKGRWLALLFALFICLSATQMLRGRRPVAAREMPGRAGQFGIGGGNGFLSGLVGAGGAFVSVPIMVWCNVPIHNAMATSAALGFPIALAGTIANIVYGWGEPGLPDYSLGFIYVPALALIVTASMIMAPVGARMAHRMPVRKLQRVFAIILYSLAAYMFWKAAH
jgi:uncharacterized membrane protein YfcA